MTDTPTEGGAPPKAPTSIDLEELLEELADDRDRRRQVEAATGLDLDAVLDQRRGAITRGGERKGTVIVLPGVMGSHLEVRRNGRWRRVWVGPTNLSRGRMTWLQHDQPLPEVEPTGLVDAAYLPMLVSLPQHWRVLAQPYDWRLPLADSADRLADAVRPIVGPVHLLAHSMGGLVARMFIARHPDLWDRLCDPAGGLERGGRLVMLGTPNRGSYASVMALTGEERLVKLLARLSHGLDRAGLRDVVASFPGFYSLLPAPDVDLHDDVAELYDVKKWKSPRSVREELLKAARSAHEVLKPVRSPERLVYVAGSGHRTPFRVLVGDEGFTYGTTLAGDGRVPHELGLLDGVVTYYSGADHGGLVKEPDVTASLDRLLRFGEAARLLSTPPGLARDADEAARYRADELEDISGLPAWFDGAAQLVATRGSEDDEDAADPGIERAAQFAAADYLGAPAAPDGSAPTDPVAAPLRVTISHAAVERADHVVLVGHYDGAPITGAEAHLDRCFDGRLAHHQLVGDYAGPIGTSVEIAPPPRAHPQEGVIVVGLGAYGSLSVSRLAESVRTAVVRHALQRGERTGVAELGVSSLLIGSDRRGGISVQESVVAVVEGVLAANRTLSTGDPIRSLRIRAIQFIEHREDRAELASAAVDGLRRLLAHRLDPPTALDPHPEPQTGDGALFRAEPVDRGTGLWQRISVTTQAAIEGSAGAIALDRADPATATAPLLQFTYTVSGAAAAQDRLAVEVERSLLDGLLAGDVQRALADPDLGLTLYETLVPNELKDELASADTLELVVDAAAADIPWEMLRSRGRGSGDIGQSTALALRTAVVRQLGASDDAPRPRRGLRAERRALVIGNPPGGPGLADLPGALAEATAVAELLEEHGYEVTRCLFEASTPALDSWKKVVHDLHRADYQIMHLAGHGVFDPQDPSASGIAIGEGRVLTARTMARLAAPPDLVVLNCCHLGAMGGLVRPTPFSRLAASISYRLMRCGVRAVVAAGWAVEDRAAQELARTFYDQLLAGIDLRTAIHQARTTVYDGHPDSSTWGAYQCYGDPGFRVAAGRPPSEDRPPRTRPELLRRIEQLTTAPDVLPTHSVVEALDRLAAEVLAKFDRSPSGELAEAVARAYGDLAKYEQALTWYRRALASPKEPPSIRALEQASNLAVRYAQSLVRLEQSEPPGVEHLLTDAGGWLDLANRVARTPERYALEGSLAKKAVTIRRPSLHDGQLSACLRDAAVAYHNAYMVTSTTAGQRNAYHTLNRAQFGALALHVALLGGRGDQVEILGALGAGSVGEFLRDVKAHAAEFDVPVEDRREFWPLVASCDAGVTTAVVAVLDGGRVQLDEHLDALAERYCRVARAFVTPRVWASVTDHLCDLADILTLIEQPADARALTELVNRIDAALTGVDPAAAR